MEQKVVSLKTNNDPEENPLDDLQEENTDLEENPLSRLYGTDEGADYCDVSKRTYARFLKHPDAPRPMVYCGRHYMTKKKLNQLIELHITDPD